MGERTFTEQEVISALTAVIKAERGRAKFDRSKVLAKAEQLADGNARLLAYARTGDVNCLEDTNA
jgi:hypothetical protein